MALLTITCDDTLFAIIQLLEKMEQPQNIYSVSEITREIKEILELQLPAFWVQGEISNFVHHNSGHMYFSLKDENAQIPCVMWRSRNAGLLFRPGDGRKVNVYGNITVYEKRGAYQLDVLKMAPVGMGELQMAFEELKEKLKAEGLFDESFKKNLPEIPQRIGIVTSQTGAAIRDIVTGLNNRLPGVEKILRPTLVQGGGAAKDIAAAIREFNEYKNVDVILVGRGGGSMEDLWAFNEEVVARAIFASEIPVVSAVGHQVDFTISDFCADVRAATPSAAAELLVPDRRDVAAALHSNMSRCVNTADRRLTQFRDQLSSLSHGYAFRRPLDIVLQNRQKIDELLQIIGSRSGQIVRQKRVNHDSQQKRLDAMRPESILNRGYAIVHHKKSNSIVRSAAQLAPNDAVSLYFSQGGADAHVDKINIKKTMSELSKGS